MSVSFWDPTELVKLVSNEPVTGAEQNSGYYIVDASHLSSSLLGRKAHGYTYLNARPDDTYPESRYEHVSTSTAEPTESTEPVGQENAGEAGEAGETGEADTDAEFDRLLSSVTPAPPAPTRLIYPPLKPPRRIRTRRASNRKRRS